jgi:hypothetical protein
MSGPYSARGPFVNGGPPALDQVFFNGLEGWLTQADATTGSSTISGSTSGTAQLIQPFQGYFKVVVVQLVNFRNGGAGAQTLALPVPFTISLHGWNSGIGGAVPQLMKAGVAQTVQEFLSAAGGAAGGVSPQTTLLSNWLWHCDTFIDTVSFPGSNANTTNGQLIMIGI